MKVSLRNVKPRFELDETKASQVWGKNLEIEGSSIVELSGPSGSGKTTLVSYIYGLRGDYDGEILINGRDIRTLADSDWPKMRTGILSIVFQDLRVFDFFTGMENIIIKAALYGGAAMEKVPAMAEELGVGSALGKPLSELSMGEKQRIAIIRALVGGFELLVLDEHTSHLDARHAEAANRLILRRCKELGAGILCAALDPSDSLPYTSKARV